MKFLKNLLIISLCFSFIVSIHELGHLISGLVLGLDIKSFNVGIGTNLLSLNFFNIDWNLNLLPLGGYVHFTENIELLSYKNLITLFAGPLFSILLAMVLIFIFYFINLKYTNIFIDNETNNKLYSIGLNPLKNLKIQRFFFPHTGHFYEFDEDNKIKRTDQTDLNSNSSILYLSNSQILKKALRLTLLFPIAPFISLEKEQRLYHFASRNPNEESGVSGPILIFYEIVQNFNYSPITGLMYLANFSFSLAILNLLPIYPTDGGKIFTTLVGGLSQSIPSEENVWVINLKVLAISFLLVLFIKTTISDIIKLWKKRKK
jgi:membrane-associated protease RseP (regulator of RpoE activity)